MSSPPRPFQGQRVPKPWGYELIWAHTDRYVGKILHIETGHSLSLQYHEVKDETLCVLSGRLQLDVGDNGAALERLVLQPGDSIHMPARRVHRLRALETCDVLEASSPELDDVVRLVDDYGRAPRS
jgi:mannose-6-phosphate isomerase-like protein (cupin superfamily)